ncbi:T9SS type B sorting domain-containing protein [Belliella pelovolcani]|uniref:Gliding motility-associated C-terminal domain-containing protein n=1 Tax=Belliella pelovolcani TaxID=529505 RepID=A0A1N7PNN2_9BACT|nr:gliding motility-associated C-terminal domain-containing protein [Belliella pelovolcani]SIT12263.1 gliding motility-associated C-terminal domain-containing protein [Belliella pelovolcani]
MKKNLLVNLILTVILYTSLPFTAFAQINTITFNEVENNQALGKSYTNSGFTFAVNLDISSIAEIISRQNAGFGGSMAITDNNFAIGGITRWTITRSSGDPFQFRSIFLQQGDPDSSDSGTIQGFKNGSPTGPAKTLQFNSVTAGLKDYAGDPDFFDVDEIRIEASDINFNLDHFTYGPPFFPVDTDPTEVTSIFLTGTPPSNANSIVFVVNFSKTALNVSTDDFQLTTTGTVVGTVSSVSGSGSSYSVTVSGISGDGSLRLDLRSGTNISNENGNTGTPAFTSGQLHFVSPCFIETFEDETIGSKTFTGNGLTFSLLGNWEVQQETPFAGIGGSQKHLSNTGVGPYTITSTELVTMNKLALYLSSNPTGTNPTNDGTVTVKGFNDDVERFSLTKSSGFPTDFSTNGGYFFVDFATEGGENNSNKRIDRIEVTIGGNFVYLNLDNFEWCESAPNNPPTVASSIPDQIAIQDVAFSFQFSEDTFEDVDVGDVLIYSAQLEGGASLPSWLSFDASTRTFSGTPSNSNLGALTIEVIADDQEGGNISDQFILNVIPAIAFEDESFVFDGSEKSIEISGTLPDGATVVYSNNTRTNVGTQLATATISSPDFSDIVLTADLTITPASITGITFEDGIFVFDATEQVLEISGTLPVGTSVSYENNTRTNVGTQEATATITGSNYNTLLLTAELRITPATVTGISFEDGNFAFDGTEKTIEITGTLPAGTSVSYENNTRTNVGTQEATATITGSNFSTLILTAELTITPATVTGISFEDGTFTFDGTEKTIEITGTLPAGTSVSYENNTRTNVGTQEATATITGSNFNDLVLTAELRITPAMVTGISFEDGTFVFDGTERIIEITGTLPAGTSVSYENNTRTNVGTQEATATITGSNFNDLVLTAELRITPATVTGISFEDGTFVFDSTEKTIEITGTLPAGTSVSYENNTRTNVGTQEATATITGSNFSTLILTAELTITPATVTGISFEDGTFVFDGTERIIEITGTLPAGTSVSYENNTRTNVGTQEATATITGSNFSTLILTAELIITPATVTGISFEDGTFVFDGTERTIEITGTLPAGTSVSYENNTRTNVGTQEATATITGSNFSALILTAELTITPATVTGISFDDGTFVFDGTERTIEIAGTLPAGTSVSYENNTRTNVGTQEATATITGSNFSTLLLTAELTITPAPVTGISFDDGIFVFDGTEKAIEITGTLPAGTTVFYENNTRTTIGNQEATATITGSNFNTLVLTADLTITPADITGIIFEDASFVFDGFEKSIEIEGVLPDGTAVSYTNNLRTDAGSQQAVATISGGVYNTLVLTADLTITPADITGITFEDASFVFDGTEKSLEITGTLPAGTTVTYADNARTNVGTQEATATITGSNYNTLLLTADLTIAPADITGITFEDASFVFDGTEKSLEITGTLPAGTTVTYSDNARTNVGTQEATAFISGSNYNTLVLTADLTITPADITGITFEDASFVFDGTEKSLEITGTLPAGTTVTYADNARTNVGTQEATATITGSNYNTLLLTADLTIAPADITGITFEDASFVFDGTEKSLEITGTLPAGTTVTYADNARTNVGTQEATATITGSNFNTLVLTADLTITPADITGVNFEDASFVFDGTEKSLEITGTLPAGTTLTYVDNARTNVGTQEATATITGSNYNTLLLTANLAITPADIAGITFEDASFVFDGTEKSLEITGTLPAGTTVTYADNARTNVGTQEATATITGSNYNTLLLTADLAITPADIAGITFEDASFVFDGTEKSLEITGTLPAGTTVTYADNARTNVGAQEATATITGSNYNTLVLTADLTIDPASLLIVPTEGQSKIFGTQDPQFTFTVLGLIGDDDENLLEGSLGRTAGESVGTFAFNLGSLSVETNYQLSLSPENFEILPAVIEMVLQPSDISTPWGVNPEIPELITVMTQDGQFLELQVNWDTSSLNTFARGTYLLTGTLILPNGILNPEDLTPELNVEVLPKPLPQDLLLSNNSFEATAAQQNIFIGSFTIVDPIDDQHVLSLPSQAVDNRYFQIANGDLFWNTSERLEGRTQFTIMVLVLDRDGNTLEKQFTITRNRASVSSIEVFNSFTPNGDNVNDTWGVEALRYYRGVRIQVFERSGKRVFYTENPDVKWDGTFEGIALPVGTYYWAIEVRETGEIRKGMLNLFRK